MKSKTSGKQEKVWDWVGTRPVFMAEWDCITGKTSTLPFEDHVFKAGEYFIITRAYEVDRTELQPYDLTTAYSEGEYALYNGSCIRFTKPVNTPNDMRYELAENYRPKGKFALCKTHMDVELERETVSIGQIYIFDGEDWVLTDLPSPIVDGKPLDSLDRDITLKLDRETATILRDAISHEVRKIAQSMPPAKDSNDSEMMVNAQRQADAIKRLIEVYVTMGTMMGEVG